MAGRRRPDDGQLHAALEGTIRTALPGIVRCRRRRDGTAERSEQSCYEQIYGSTIGGDPVPLSPFSGSLGLA